MKDFAPDLIFTNQRHDLHQDHRMVSELTWNALRDHLVLEYEVPKYDGDFGVPNVYVPLAEATCRRKVESSSVTSAHSGASTGSPRSCCSG
jgi:LmbE family N-acetylglucosaminyl deacetylase